MSNVQEIYKYMYIPVHSLINKGEINRQINAANPDQRQKDTRVLSLFLFKLDIVRFVEIQCSSISYRKKMG